MSYPTLMAFFMYLALSLSMSWCERIGSFSSSFTTCPGPWRRKENYI